MSESNNESSAQRPALIAFNVTESTDGKGYWNRVGAAWEHKDGKGYEVDLDSVPVNGRITLRELRDEQMIDYEEQRQEQAPQDRERDNTKGHSRGRTR